MCSISAKNRLLERRHTSKMQLFPTSGALLRPCNRPLEPIDPFGEWVIHILVVCDRFTKLTRALKLKEGTALAVISAFIDSWAASFGIPETVLTDKSSQLASLFIQGVLGMLWEETNYTTPHHAQTIGQVERKNSTVVRQLRCYVAEHQREWDRYLSLLKTAYNTQVHSSSGEIPFAFVSPRRLILMGVKRIPRLGMVLRRRPLPAL